jgi:hypothetical protein
MLGPLLSQASALDTVTWENKQRILGKAGFTRDKAEYLVLSNSGGNQVRLTLSHVSTSRNLFSFSKREVDRWGDPEGVLAQPGAWQVVSNGANDVVLGVWGYWGWGGAAGSPHLVSNESTSYEPGLTFERPVTDLSLSLHGLNALLAPGSSNMKDELTAQAFFKAAPVAGVSFETLGQGMVRQGNGVSGNVSKPFGASKNYFDEGSVVLRFNEKTDKVVLRFTNRAITPSLFFLPMANKRGHSHWVS